MTYQVICHWRINFLIIIIVIITTTTIILVNLKGKKQGWRTGEISLLRSINIRLDTSCNKKINPEVSFCCFLFLERKQLFIAFMEKITYSLAKRLTDVLYLPLKISTVIVVRDSMVITEYKTNPFFFKRKKQ